MNKRISYQNTEKIKRLINSNWNIELLQNIGLFMNQDEPIMIARCSNGLVASLIIPVDFKCEKPIVVIRLNGKILKRKEYGERHRRISDIEKDLYSFLEEYL